jgi:hypothetical protein
MQSGQYVIPEKVKGMKNLINFDELAAEAGLSGVEIPKNLAKGISDNSISAKDAIEALKKVADFDNSDAVKNAEKAGIKIPEFLRKGIASGKLSVEDAMKRVSDLTSLDKAVQKAGFEGLEIPKALAKSVLKGKTSVEDAQKRITDTRANTQICGWVTGLIRQVDTSQLFLQWQDAYEKNIAEMDEWKKKQQDSFDEWFRTLTDQLNVKTKLYDYKKTVTLEEDSDEIHIGDNFYNQDDTVLYANINGIQLVEGVDYTIEGIGAGSYLKLKNVIETGNIIEIRTMRSVIG